MNITASNLSPSRGFLPQTMPAAQSGSALMHAALTASKSKRKKSYADFDDYISRKKPTRDEKKLNVLAHMKKHAIEPGLRERARAALQTSAANSGWAGSAWSQVSEGANRLWQQLPSFGLQSDANKAALERRPEEKTFTPRGGGGILISEFDRRELYGKYQINGVSTHHELTPTLRRFVGKNGVHVMPASGESRPFLRNVATEGPNGMITSKLRNPISRKRAGKQKNTSAKTDMLTAASSIQSIWPMLTLCLRTTFLFWRTAKRM